MIANPLQLSIQAKPRRSREGQPASQAKYNHVIEITPHLSNTGRDAVFWIYAIVLKSMMQRGLSAGKDASPGTENNAACRTGLGSMAQAAISRGRSWVICWTSSWPWKVVLTIQRGRRPEAWKHSDSRVFNGSTDPDKPSPSARAEAPATSTAVITDSKHN